MRKVALGLFAALVLSGASLAQPGSLSRPDRGHAVATIETVAGTGVDASDGDGGPALAAAIDHPRGIAVLADGSFVFAQPFIPMVRRVSPQGVITRIMGDGTHGYSGDGGPASAARLALVHGVAALPDGGFVVADMLNNRIRRVWPTGIVTTVVGTGARGFSGDGGPATAATIAAPRGISARANGELLIPDSGNARIRRVLPDGTISTVAGTGEPGYSGDGGPATSAQLNRPFSVAPLPGGGYLIADLDNNRIRRVDAGGTITTVAGTGEPGYSGDGGPATAAAIYQPHAVAALPDGGFLVADTYNHRVRRVWPNGRITTVAGNGVAGFSGDGPAAAVQLDMPKALAVLPDASGFLVGDAENHRIRLVRVNLRPALALKVTTPRLKTRAGRAASLRYTLSEAAAVRAEIVSAGAFVSSSRAAGRRGANVLSVGRALRPGTYAVHLRAATADGRVALGRASLTVRR